MQSNEFEAAFEAFLERREYEEAENYLFSMVRTAFSAGWVAADGDPPSKTRIFQIIPPTSENKN